MKTLLLTALLTTMSLVQAAPKTHHLKMDWEDEFGESMEMEDYERLVITLPNDKSFNVKAEINSNVNMIEKCKVIGIKTKAKTVDVIVELGETNRDDGMNGCGVTIYRNHPNDEDGIGIVNVEFGYFIDL